MAEIARLAIADFRCFTSAEVELGPGLTVVRGPNGQGKTSLLEALGWPSRARSIRGVPDGAVVRRGQDAAVVRCEVRDRDRVTTFAAEIRASGRNRMQLNGRHLARQRDLFGFLRVTVFAPDDLALVKGGPTLRREYLDELLQMLAPRYVAALADYERVLRQRNALLRAATRERLDAATLAVFDEQLVAAGAEVVRGRLRLLARLAGPLTSAYRRFGAGEEVMVDYTAEWCDEMLDERATTEVDDLLRSALAARHTNEIERQATLVGPHRDDVRLQVGGLDARTQASQGEQRSLALALRLAGHAVITERAGAPPVLLLDDVFSELDERRSAALVELLPEGQTVLTTASRVPAGVQPRRELVVEDAKLREP